jgi:glycosyltransferase involved in cell wall biosynthesis
MPAPSRARAAIVQDWFFAPGGSEEVAIELGGLLPGADIYTSFIEPEYRPRLAGHSVRPWPLQRVVGPTRRYRSLLPLYPLWFSHLDLSAHDLVVSSSSAFAKAVRTRPKSAGGLHVAYIHSPMRYAWDLETYLAGSSVSMPARLAARTIRSLLRRWDRSTARRPDVLVANSTAVRERIGRLWGRDAEVIHPPVRVGEIRPSARDDGFLLVVARMLAYRRLDLAIAAANRLKRELVLVGDGPEEARLRSLAGPTVRFAGRIPRPQVLDLFGRCHAYVVPGEEDFGMAPVEAMAAGKPVIALRAGGALDTIVDGRTGVFFDRPTVDNLCAAIKHLDSMDWNVATIRLHAESFDTAVFRRRFRQLLERLGVEPSLYRPS